MKTKRINSFSTDLETVCTLGQDTIYYVQIKRLYLHWDQILYFMYRSRDCMQIGTRYYILCTDQETVCTLGLDILFYVQIKRLYVHCDQILYIMYRSRDCMYIGTRYYILCTDQETVCTLRLENNGTSISDKVIVIMYNVHCTYMFSLLVKFVSNLM